MEIPKVFAELQKEAHADLLLKDPSKPQDLTETTRQLLTATATSRAPPADQAKRARSSRRAARPH